MNQLIAVGVACTVSAPGRQRGSARAWRPGRIRQMSRYISQPRQNPKLFL